MTFADATRSAAYGIGTGLSGVADYAKRAIDPNDKTADSLIFFGGLSIVVLCFIEAWAVVVNKAQVDSGFGISVAAILAGISGGKALRSLAGNRDGDQSA